MGYGRKFLHEKGCGWRRHRPHACLILGVALAAYTTGSPVGDVVGMIEDSIIRDTETVRTASGRATIFSVLRSEALQFPLGMGYAAGPRVFLQRAAMP